MYFNNFDHLVNANATTYSHVSKETGISKATISAWKKGDYTPKLDKLQKIADFFKVPIDELIRSDEDDITVKLGEAYSPKVMEIVEILNSLPQEERRTACNKILGYLNVNNPKYNQGQNQKYSTKD